MILSLREWGIRTHLYMYMNMHVYVCTKVCVLVYVFAYTFTQAAFTYVFTYLSLKLFLRSHIQKKWSLKKHFMSREWSMTITSTCISRKSGSKIRDCDSDALNWFSKQMWEQEQKKEAGPLSPKAKPARNLLPCPSPGFTKIQGGTLSEQAAEWEKSPLLRSGFTPCVHTNCIDSTNLKIKWYRKNRRRGNEIF